jgi:hypothetical protein
MIISAPLADPGVWVADRERVETVTKQILLQTIMPSMMRDDIHVTLNALAVGLACVYVTAGARRDRRRAWAYFTKALEHSCTALVDQLRAPPRHRYVGEVFCVGDEQPWFNWWVGAAYDSAAPCLPNGGAKGTGQSLKDRFLFAGITPGSYSRRREEARLEALLARLNWRATGDVPEQKRDPNILDGDHAAAAGGV